MHLLDYRDALWREVDHAPGGSPEAVVRTNKDIERALFQLFAEAPYLFRIDERRINLDPDIVMEDATDLIEMASNPAPPVDDAWVVQTTYNTADAKADKWLDQPRSYLDGRMLRITDPDDPGYFQFFRIREMFLEAPDPDVPADVRVRMSLHRPLPDGWTKQPLEWQVITSEYALPNDIIRIADLSVDIGGSSYPVSIVHQGEVEDTALVDPGHLGGTGGSPLVAYRRQAEGLPRPLVPASVEVDPEGAAGSWDLVTSPLGTFEYFWTVSMGFRFAEAGYGDPRKMADAYFHINRLQPYWESAPSPVSELVTVSSGTTVVTLKFPDLQRVIGFSNAATIRNERTGIYINIYRRRVTADANGRAYASEHAYYLDRFKADGTVEYVDDGSVLPAHTVPLRENTKYQTLRFLPNPDASYRIRMRAYLRPIPPKDDYEDVPIPDDAQNALISLAAQHFYRRAGNAAFAAHYQQLYMDAKALLARTYGQAKPRKHPARRGMMGVRRLRHSRDPVGLVRDV